MSSTLDKSVECIKSIVDFHRCRICDKVESSYVRYPCGHTACSDCLLDAPSCLSCLTPPDIHTYTVTPDKPFTLRAKNALALKKAFEDTFNVDIYKRHRLSEKLKIEQELFPTPVKVSVTYFNKRKSSPSKNKENISIPGEQTSPISKMATDKSSYVQQWLDRMETSPRKPFADLDVNRSIVLRNTPIKQKADLILDKTYKKLGLEVQKNPVKKTPYFRKGLSTIKGQSKLNKYPKLVKNEETAGFTTKKFKEDFGLPEKFLNNKKQYVDESGIVMDEEIISINDSQSVVVDKDREACLAVLQAGETAVSKLTPRLECTENVSYTLDVDKTLHLQEQKNTSTYHKIPFIKRSSLSESCQFCSDSTKFEQNQTAGRPKSVSITIENNSFITTITVSDNKKIVGSNTKKSTYVQTEAKELLCDQSIATRSDHGNVCMKQSQDLFTVDGPQNENLIELTVEKSEPAQNKMTTRIPDSDSDEDPNQSGIIQVTADVHGISDPINHGVLSELEEKDLRQKTKPKKRRKTPASSDSSEKENFDPNKCKRRKLEKKTAKNQKTKRTLLE